MSECDKIERCLFFNEKLANMPLIANSLKNMYCKDDYNSCARFMVCEELGSENVPKDLFPNNQNKAQRILKESKVPV